ncbi:anti-sigma factor family protein [Dietzia sp. PP-33]|uniref:anti-sigma factor family protein n=1 Tax=Dietzia sp. PP-33 TaxID=2957500 RepID=UPI0029A35937|nr:zf-HC2 domain-containing protein [Dietzia sp. PP-33]MDX2355767.1 zf-HC2 domain-containing protein [Dietzia sp. PP-33]
MDRHHRGHGSDTEYRLSRDSVREVAGRTPPPRSEPHFLSTDHLSTEAAAAYVDGCLPPSGQVRADAHLAQCPQCRREVADQQDARRALRGSGPIHMPGDLRERLRLLGEGTDVEPPSDPESQSGTRWARLLRRLRGSGR